ALEGLDLPQDARVPLGEVEALRDEPVHAREVLVAEQLESVVDALEEDGVLDLQLTDPAEGGARRAGHLPEAERAARQSRVRLVERVVQPLVAEAHLQQLDVGELEHRTDAVAIPG